MSKETVIDKPVHSPLPTDIAGFDSLAELALNMRWSWRLLSALGIKPEVCHLNEGHAAFAVLERARDFMQEASQPFEVALAVTRAGNLFTTHTAVAAGFDRFAPALIEQYPGDRNRDSPERLRQRLRWNG
jgi:starch phosphorylase